MQAACHLLVGEDDWSKNQFIKTIKTQVLASMDDLMNYYEAKDKEVSVSAVQDVIETLPFFAEQKLIYLKDTGLFKPGKKDETEAFEKVIETLPDYLVMIIDEKEVDKRSRLYKIFQKKYEIKNFDYPGEEAAYQYFMEEAQKEGIVIEASTLRYFIQHMPEDMNYMRGEWQKLLGFSSEERVTKAHIDEVCVFSLETRVFEMVKKIVAHEAKAALGIYERMMQSKESPIGVLVLIARQYRMMLQIKYLTAKNKNQKEIATLVKLPYFAVKEMQMQVKNYSFDTLEHILKRCLETDTAIKTGKMEMTKAVEALILECLLQ